MTFIWPQMLLVLLLIPFGVALYLSLGRRRRRAVAAFGGFGAAATDRPVRRRRFVGPAFMLTGLTIVVFGLARPQTVVSLPSLEGTIVLAFDVSASMAATDFAPTRMEAAKAAARA